MEFILFKLESEQYAIALNDVSEILQMAAIKSIPGAPDFIQGVFNLRGELLPVVDMLERFNPTIKTIQTTQYTQDTRLIIVAMASVKVAVILRGWERLLGVDDENCHEHVVKKQGLPTWVSNLAIEQGKILQLIDIKQILNAQELTLLSDSAL